MELAGLAVVVVGYTALMLLLFELVLPEPGTYEPWDRALTSASVVRTHLPAALTTLVFLALVGALRWWRRTGITSTPRFSPWGVLPVGALAGFVVFLGAPVVGIGDDTFLVTLLAGMLVWAFVEELQMRGVVMYGLARRSNPWRAAWVTTLLFGLAHLSSLLTGWSFSHASAQLIAATMDGGVLAKMRIETRSLWFPTFAHALGNFVLYLHRVAYPYGDRPYTLLRVAGWVLGIGLLVRFVVLDVRTTRLSRRARRAGPAGSVGDRASRGSPRRASRERW
jgi:membrane protease YdiL (CAAX protease family)